MVVDLERKIRRRKQLIRAVYTEFMCAFIFYSTSFAFRARAGNDGVTRNYEIFTGAFARSFISMAMSFTFSGISGSQINPALTFSLWISGRTDATKFTSYVTVQFLASVLAILVSYAIIEDSLVNIATNVMRLPVNSKDVSAFFFSEFCMTFALVFMSFTVAFEESEKEKIRSTPLRKLTESDGLSVYLSTPQSRTGFAPFAIGFMIFSMNLMTGNSNSAFNPASLFGPAIFCGKWYYVYYYWIAEFSGAACAGLLVRHTHAWGLSTTEITVNEEIFTLVEKPSDNGNIVGELEEEEKAIDKEEIVVVQSELKEENYFARKDSRDESKL